VVDLISNADEAFGVIVPIPALPDEGKTFVCAWRFAQNIFSSKKIDPLYSLVFIIENFI
jgi:hypothetical protein